MISGWEQPAWFALEGDEKGYKPSFERTNWFHAVGRECNLVMNKVGILDLTPFAKIDVRGKHAAEFLDRILANKIPKVSIFIIILLMYLFILEIMLGLINCLLLISKILAYDVSRYAFTIMT